MKRFLLLPIALCASVHAESVIPTAFDRARYEETYSTSPFVLATPLPPPTEPAPPDLFANLVVTGIGKLDDGRNFVIIRRAGDETSMRFEGAEPNHEGYSVKQVKLADRWGESSIILAKDGKEGALKFNQNAAVVPPAKPKQPGPRPPKIIPTGGRSEKQSVVQPPRPH